ncbi:hypothetical protein BSK59_15885 [Paenibacillus odorifer]|uniref:hypothetical protein n=1 Tax=Paenibacillus odorifer TaxID=189426 RepID=UPI00096F7860|nr:hypothetical protein [Paenibacillus odorifer]OME54061.1 hypothetical protein BSK59_15885 [Paenibacillus odorifer]
MARRKKETVEGTVESHIDTVARFIKHCFKGSQEANIRLRFGETYLIGGLLYTFNKDVLGGMIESGRVKVTYENDAEVNFRGISS